MLEIQKTIDKLEEEINNKQNQVNLLNQLADNEIDFTEEIYHQLCLTNLRGQEILSKMLLKQFPFLEVGDKIYNVNDYYFKLTINNKKYIVSIPQTAR